MSSGEKSTSGCPQARKRDSRGPAKHVGVAWGDWVLCPARAIESDIGEGDVTRWMRWGEDDVVSMNGQIEVHVTQSQNSAESQDTAHRSTGRLFDVKVSVQVHSREQEDCVRHKTSSLGHSYLLIVSLHLQQLHRS
jgi:hypothetical protein